MTFSFSIISFSFSISIFFSSNQVLSLSFNYPKHNFSALVQRPFFSCSCEWFFNKFHFLSKIFPNIFSGSFVLLVDLFSLTTNWSLKIGSVTKSGPTIPLANRCWIWYWRYRCSWSFLRIIPLWLVFQHEPTMFKLKESTIFIFI